MKTFYSKFEDELLSVGYEMKKDEDGYWNLIDNGASIMQNKRRGELLAQAYKTLGGG